VDLSVKQMKEDRVTQNGSGIETSWKEACGEVGNLVQVRIGMERRNKTEIRDFKLYEGRQKWELSSDTSPSQENER